MKQSRKEFIKKAHSAACSEWKANIEKEFPKLFKEEALVVGKWYKRQIINGLWFVTRFENGCSYGYGFDSDGNWANVSRGYNYSLKLTIATDEEVKQALIKEAKKRGFKEGVMVVSKGYDDTVFDGEFRFEEWHKNTLDGFNAGDIFKDGVWATIKETITKEQAEKELGKTILN